MRLFSPDCRSYFTNPCRTLWTPRDPDMELEYCVVPLLREFLLCFADLYSLWQRCPQGADTTFTDLPAVRGKKEWSTPNESRASMLELLKDDRLGKAASKTISKSTCPRTLGLWRLSRSAYNSSTFCLRLPGPGDHHKRHLSPRIEAVYGSLPLDDCYPAHLVPTAALFFRTSRSGSITTTPRYLPVFSRPMLRGTADSPLIFKAY